MKIGMQCVISQGFVPAMEQAIKAQEYGFDSIHAGEHHHLPVATPVPEFYKETGVPDFYRFSPDPLITLGAMATAAPKLAVGTSILLVPIHDTLMLANQIATLDNLTGGRTSFGLGVGWNKPELAHHGVEFDTRVDKLVEQLRAMKSVWAKETARFDGKFVKFDESWQGPKPKQRPHPPLLLGGRPLKRNFQVIAEVCDGWLPTDTYAKTYGSDLEKELEDLRGAFRSNGRDPKELTNSFLMADLFLYDRDPGHYAREAPTRDNLAYYEKLGFDRVIIGLPTFSDDHFLGALDHIAKVAEPWLFQG